MSVTDLHPARRTALRPALSLRLLTPQPDLPGRARPTAHGPLVSFIGAELTIGSHPGSDLCLTGPGVAPEHCRIRERRGAQILLDHGSPGGTAVNGRTITEPTTLVEGDRISVGVHVLEVLAPRFVFDPEHVAARLRRGPRELLPRACAAPAPEALPRPHLTRTRRTGLLLALLVGVLAAAPASSTPASSSPFLPPASSPSTPAPSSPFLPAAASPATPAPFLPPASAPSSLSPRLGAPSLSSRAPAEHRVLPGETLAEIAARHGLPVERLARWNDLSPAADLNAGTSLRLHAGGRVQARELVRRRAEAGDTWDSLARHAGVAAAELRQHNPHLRSELRPGDVVDLWLAPRAETPGEPASALVPQDARSLGSPHREGELRDALRLPPHPDYDLRCPTNAHASSATAAALLAGLARLRERYRGQIVVGDLSRAEGGAYGPHLSHQSGRDVDLWLPVVGGLYRAAPACRRCGTPWCRPAPDEVDWQATWALIEALAATGAVQQIFLDRRLHPRLRAAARDAGRDEDSLARAVQRRPGAPALVTHGAGHTRHIHVRFRCGPDESSCLP